jgi:hypothetical protein
VFADVAVPVHVEQHDPDEAGAATSGEDRIALDEHVDEVVKDVVEGLVVGASGDDLELEVFDGGVVSSDDLGVLGGGEEVFDLTGVGQAAFAELLGELIGSDIALSSFFSA